MKVNVSKTEMINICVDAWGVICHLLDTDMCWKISVKRDLELYSIVLQMIEDQSLGDVDFEKNSELNAKSMVIPPDDKYNGYIQSGATLPIKKGDL